MEQPDMFDAKALRDAALEQVSINSGSWMERAMRCAALHLSGEFTGEEIRLSLSSIIEPPHHHNAWGALVCHLIRKGIVTKTGRYENMVTKKSHARATPVLRKL